MLDEVCSSGQTGHGQERRHFCFGQGTEIGPASDIAYFTNGCVISARRLGLASDRFRRRQVRAFIAVVGSVAVALGGLASYGPSLTQMWRKAAVYVDKILKGRTRQSASLTAGCLRTWPNLKTAAALGLTFPDTG